MDKKHYILIMTYQFTNFGEDYENAKACDFESDDLKDLADILNKYVSKFLTKDKKSDVWMYFHGEIQDQTKLSYDLEQTVYTVSLERKD